MVQVRFSTFELDADTNDWIELPVAELVADGDELTISGPRADWISPDISIVDPETGEAVARDPDAERWAWLLPFAYRERDIVVEVAEGAVAEPAGAAFRYATGD